MKILHISVFDAIGGAGRSALRLHQSLFSNGVQSNMRVLRSNSLNPHIMDGAAIHHRIAMQVQHKLNNFIFSKFKNNEVAYCSLGNVSAGLVKELNQSDADLLNLHWITGMLSIEDIGKINKPIVWTMHDKWALGGANHLEDQEIDFDSLSMQSSYSSLELMHAQVYKRKLRSWNAHAMSLVCPSRWMQEAANRSKLFARSKIVYIPNPIDAVNFWFSKNKLDSRKLLGLSPDKKLIFFGAYGGGHDRNKGLDLLISALHRYKLLFPNNELEVVICADGSQFMYQSIECPYPINYVKNIDSDVKMRDLYTAADIVALPSRVENFPNSALEANSCSTPVIAFDIGGISDIVVHQKTGWLANPYDVDEFAHGMGWLMCDEIRLEALGNSGRERVLELFDSSVVAKKYQDLYKSILVDKVS